MGSSMPDIAALYLAHRDSMHAVAGSVLRGVGQEDQAEDVVHDVITEMINHPPTSAVDNWEAYLVRATRNRALDRVKSAHIRHAAGPLDDSAHPSDDQYLADDVADQVDRRRAGARLWDKLATLPDRDRQMLWQTKALGLPRSEIARHFGVTPARVSQITTAALKTLKDRLEEEGPHS